MELNVCMLQRGGQEFMKGCTEKWTGDLEGLCWLKWSSNSSVWGPAKKMWGKLGWNDVWQAISAAFLYIYSIIEKLFLRTNSLILWLDFNCIRSASTVCIADFPHAHCFAVEDLALCAEMYLQKRKGFSGGKYGQISCEQWNYTSW